MAEFDADELFNANDPEDVERHENFNRRMAAMQIEAKKSIEAANLRPKERDLTRRGGRGDTGKLGR